MFTENQVIRFILAFKIRHLRLEKKLSYQELSEKTSLSTSYLSDIEKGKRYPKPDKISKLAEALDVQYDYLVSTSGSKKLRPIIGLINSNFLKLFPLDEFGISMDKVLDMFSQTPDRINAFISTFFRISRNYQINEQEFYMEALRSYQDMHNNNFPLLEEAANGFRNEHFGSLSEDITTDYLEEQLEEIFDIKIDKSTLSTYKTLEGLRSVYSKSKRTLLVQSKLNNAQIKFVIAREIGFQYLRLMERPYETTIVNVDSFEKLLNNYKASHFASALLMPVDQMVADIKTINQSKKWSSELILNVLKKYEVSPETLLQRWTNLLPKYFGLDDLFFIKLTAEKGFKKLSMSKNLHLSQMHTPYNNSLDEHFCRRWAAYKCLSQTNKSSKELVVQAQISEYWDGNSYLCISIGQRYGKQKDKMKSVTIGLLVNEKLKSNCFFLNDLEKSSTLVGTTCERCNVPNCAERQSDPIYIAEKATRDQINEELSKLL